MTEELTQEQPTGVDAAGVEEKAKGGRGERLKAGWRTARSITWADLKSGVWFEDLLARTFAAYEERARPEYLARRHPDLTRDEIADLIVGRTARTAAVAGALGGLVISLSELATIASLGLGTPILIASLAAELLYLARLQARMVVYIASLYGHSIDAHNPRDLLLIFGYALGIDPSDLIREVSPASAAGTTTSLAKTVIAREVVDAMPLLARKLGTKILGETVLRYALPVFSIGLGLFLNYANTKSLGRIAMLFFQREGLTGELASLASQAGPYRKAFPLLVLHTARQDRRIDWRETELFRSLFQCLDAEERAEVIATLEAGEGAPALALLEQTAGAPQEVRERLMDVAVQVVVADGRLNWREKAYLRELATRLQTPLDMQAVEQRRKEADTTSLSRRVGGCLLRTAMVAVLMVILLVVGTVSACIFSYLLVLFGLLL